jgi:hypothetical protein
MKKIYDKMAVKIKTENNQVDVKQFILEKIKYFQEIIQNTTMAIQEYKSMELFSNSDINVCMTNLSDIYAKTTEISGMIDMQANIENIIELLQNIIDKLSVIIGKYGTKKMDDLLFICFGSQYIHQKIENEYLQNKKLPRVL